MENTALLLSFCLIVSGCATSGMYRIKPGDELRVVIWDYMDEKVIVRPDERISLPIIGDVLCKDKTPQELDEDLSEKYKADTVVIVTKYRTLKDSIKDILGFIRDISFAYFFTRRIADD